VVCVYVCLSVSWGLGRRRFEHRSNGQGNPVGKKLGRPDGQPWFSAFLAPSDEVISTVPNG